MEKAKIKKLCGANADTTIDVMFNPTDYQITRNMNYAEVAIPGLAVPLLQFVRGEAQTLQLELFLDSSDRKAQSFTLEPTDEEPTTAGNTPVPPERWASLASSSHVEHRLMALRHLAEIDGSLHAPPVIEFSWSGARFQGVITTFTEKFAMFDAKGHVIRARVSLQLKSWTNPDQLFREPPRESPDRTKTRVVRAGERLDLIAAEEYGDPAKWTVLATANAITRPRILPPGMLLVVPPLD